MFDDMISKFAEGKKLNKFDFSLRPNHDIDNPFTNISLNIIDNLYVIYNTRYKIKEK